MFDRAQLEETIAILAAQRARFGDATVDTVIDVLNERLAALPDPPSEAATEMPFPNEQRKQVTILFATIDGFTRLTGVSHNTERLRQIDLLWRRLDETIRAHGGVVDKHMGDVIMGIFGASVSYENDPERAVRCALALRELVGEYNSPGDGSSEVDPAGDSRLPLIRIGINTGQASLGQVGSDNWLTAIGDAVNVASRLEEASAEAGVYISQDTHRLVRNLFRCESLGDFAIKGRKTPVEVYRVIGSRPRLFFSGDEGIEGVYVPMIGRDNEMGVLQDALGRVSRTGRGETLTIVGDAGVGKSRLVREFHNWLESFPIRASIFQAQSDQRLTEVPYGLFHELLFNHFAIDYRDSAEIIEAKISKAMSAWSADGWSERSAELRARAHSIARLVGLKVPASRSKGTPGRGAATEHNLALDTVVDYFSVIARRSAVALFFLEDIHWADEDSLALLERIAASAADLPFLMICLTRPTLLERRPNWPGESAAAQRLFLSPLDDADSRKLVFNILRKLPQIPSTLSDLIVRSAGGNPFYVEELVRVLIEDGVILPDESAWQLRARELTRLRVPATLTGVLQARLDRLPELERVTLQQAAIIGDEFWDSAVQQLNRASRHPFSSEQVTAALLSLERRDMIYRAPLTDFTGSQAFLFKHSVLREVAYESVLLRDRPGYHLQAARWLAGQGSGRTTEYTAPIAQHHELAGQPAEAARLYELAAVRAAEQYKLGNAIEYYRKVLDLLRDRPQEQDTRLAVKWRLGRALQAQARLVEALDIYQTMRQSAELDGNLAGQARAENAMAAVYHEQGNDEEALAAASRAEGLARLAGDELELTWALLRCAQAAGRLSRLAQAVEAAEGALEHSQSIVAPQETARGLALLAALQYEAGQPDSSRRAAAELAELASALEGRGAPEDATFALARLGELNLFLGHYNEAQENMRRALELHKSAGRGDVADMLRLLGLSAGRAGRAAEAAERLEEAAALAEATDNRYLRLSCRLAMAEALLALGQYPAAEATLRQVIAAAEDRRHFAGWRELPHAYALLIEVLEKQGRRDEARLYAA
jgi:class 3 adenylate cyclase/tetratricopeptide (TPR) repeat protein